MGVKSRKGRNGRETASGDSGPGDECPSLAGAGDAELRQLAARRRLEQYLESRRLDEHLREVFCEEC